MGVVTASFLLSDPPPLHVPEGTLQVVISFVMSRHISPILDGVCGWGGGGGWLQMFV